MILLSVDPGGTTGFAVHTTSDGKNWECTKRGIRDTKENRSELFELFRTILPDIIVCEDFRLFPWKSTAQGWSLMVESRIIGACENYCDTLSIPLVMQTTGNRDIGYKWGQIRRVPKSNPANHAYDAEAHAAFYIVKNGGKVK